MEIRIKNWALFCWPPSNGSINNHWEKVILIGLAPEWHISLNALAQIGRNL
jgi:hypothetical protein